MGSEILFPKTISAPLSEISRSRSYVFDSSLKNLNSKNIGLSRSVFVPSGSALVRKNYLTGSQLYHFPVPFAQTSRNVRQELIELTRKRIRRFD